MSIQTLSFLLLSILLVVLCRAEIHEQDLTEPQSCTSSVESPIAILSSEATKESSIVEFNWQEVIRPRVHKNGIRHKIVYTESQLFDETTVVDGVVYTMKKLNFHYGSDANKGSEHSVDGSFFPGEIEIIHDRKDESATLSSPDFLIVSIFFKENAELTHDPEALSTFQTNIPKIDSDWPQFIANDNEMQMDSLLPEVKSDFFTYVDCGTSLPSITGIKRIVFKNPIEVTTAFMAALRGIQDRDGTAVAGNARTIQDHSNGVVYKSFGE